MSKTFGKKIKEIRLSRNMTQEQFAHSLGYADQSVINKIELGKKEMSFNKLVTLTQAYLIDFNDLFETRQKEPKNDKKNRDAVEPETVNSTDYIEKYYQSHDEDHRLTSRHGSVELITTMKYIHTFLKPGMKVLEVGAGTGRYSLALAQEGYDVVAVELVESNLKILQSKMTPGIPLEAFQGNALDLTRFSNQSFDIVLLLGPMYHMFSEKDKVRVLLEAKRVLRDEGTLFVAYCMNEPTLITWGFQGDGHNIMEAINKHMLTKDFHCLSKPQDLFELVRIEDMNRLNRLASFKRIRLVATDLFTRYLDAQVDSWEENVFNTYLSYHLTICERSDLVGLSHHTLDILKKN